MRKIIDYEINKDYDFIKEFISKLYSDYLDEKNTVSSKKIRVDKELCSICEKIVVLTNKIDYNEQLFNPNYDYSIDEEKLKLLQEDKKDLENQSDYINEEYEKVNTKIKEIEKFIRQIDDVDYYNENSCNDDKIKIEILRTQELERKRIARELHDTIVQNITMLIHKSELAIKVIDSDIIRAKLELSTISKNLREMVNDMRDVIYDLRPMALDDMGINIVMEREISKYRKAGLIVNYSVEGPSEKIDYIMCLTLLRIIQEACNNTMKHANATTIDIKFVYTDEYYELYYSDDGIGFDIDKETCKKFDNHSGYGISIIYERAYLLSAEVEINSDIGKGMSINIKVPKKTTEVV